MHQGLPWSNNVSFHDTWRLWTSERPLDLLRLKFRFRLRVIKSVLILLTLISYFINLPLAFLFINKLTKSWKINNMHFRTLILLYDFYAGYMK
jgi:hypothetical protein